MAVLLLFCACNTQQIPEQEITTQEYSEMTQNPIETEPEMEALPYLIPYPTRVNLAELDEDVFDAAFGRGTATKIKQTEQGLVITGTKESRDPGIKWNISSMYQAAGYPISEDGESYVPFMPEQVKVIVLKVQAEWGGAFELYYATEDRHNAKGQYCMTEIYGGDSEFFGERVWQYIIFEADEDTPGWATRFNDGFRMDHTNFIMEGDVFVIEQIAFCADRTEAEAYIAKDKGEPAPVPAVEQGYYVCLYEDRLHLPEDNVKSVFASLDEAKEYCDKYAKYGYRVANEQGEILYAPHSLLQSNILRESYYVVTYAREQKFEYGDSCTNPGINHRPHRTSCDRLVDWVLYRAGFTDQPLVQGKVVSNLAEWCEQMGFEKITREEDLQAGDIVFVRPDSKGIPGHVYILATEVEDGQALRYDHGSNTRIMNKKQPTKEPISYGDAPFVYAYRPVITQENNIYYQQMLDKQS